MNVNGNQIETDKDGYLRDLNDWTPDVARMLSEAEHIELSEAHWEIIYLLRDFYQEFQISPAMRALVKRTAQIYGAEKGRSIYLLSLFPPSPARIATKIAGLPRPANCF
jgi:tRNA 2-thiouridine synthesizing protein E